MVSPIDWSLEPCSNGGDPGNGFCYYGLPVVVSKDSHDTTNRRGVVGCRARNPYLFVNTLTVKNIVLYVPGRIEKSKYRVRIVSVRERTENLCVLQAKPVKGRTTDDERTRSNSLPGNLN